MTETVSSEQEVIDVSQEDPPAHPLARARRRLAERARHARPAWLGLFAFCMFAAASIALYASPIWGQLSSRYVGVGKGDSKLYLWSLSWLPWAISHGENPFFTHMVFSPGGVDLTWVTTLPGPSLLMWPITRTFGPLVSYNLLLLAAPALAAWATYLACHRVTRAFWPSVAGGYLFGFSTYLVAQLHGHVNLVLIFPVPLAVYLVVRRVEGSVGRVAFVGLLGLTLLGLFSISTELFATATMFGAIALLGALAFGGQLRKQILMTGVLVAAAYVMVGIVLLPFLLPALHNAPQGAIRPLDRASLDGLSFVVPRFSTLIGGQRFATFANRFTANVVEDGGYLGIPLVVMLVLFASTERRSRVTWLLLGFIGVVALLALGPILHVDGDPGVGLPGEVVGKLPLIKHATPQRFSAYLALAVAIVAAIWLSHGRGRWAWARWAVVVLGALLLLPDLSSPPYHPQLSMPAFITSGAYREALSPGETVYAIPENAGEEVLWQAESDFYFRLAQGYMGPIQLPYQGKLPSIGLAQNHPHPSMPDPEVFATYLQMQRASAVLVADAAEKKFTRLLEGIGFTPRHVEDMWVWQQNGQPSTGTPSTPKTGGVAFQGDLRQGGHISSFSLPGASGGPPVTYDAYRGHPLIISFFASWCDGCRTQLVDLEQIHRSEPLVQVLGVAQSDPAPQAADTLQQAGVTFDAAADPKGAFFFGFQGTGLPLTVFVSPDGTVSAIRRKSLSLPQLQALIRSSSG